MEIKQFQYSSDNLSYVIFGRQEAVVIDGGAVDEICFRHTMTNQED